MADSRSRRRPGGAPGSRGFDLSAAFAAAVKNPFSKDDSNEANVPTSQHEPAPNPRVPQAYADQGRARRAQEPKGQGALAPLCDGIQEVVAGASPKGRFPKAERVRKRLEFRAVTEYGRRVTTPRFVFLLHARETSEGAARLGIVASRRVGHSVARSRAKRLVREAFRATRDLWKPGIDLVVIVRGPLPELKLDDVVAEWRRAERDLTRRTRDAFSSRAHTEGPKA